MDVDGELWYDLLSHLMDLLALFPAKSYEGSQKFTEPNQSYLGIDNIFSGLDFPYKSNATHPVCCSLLSLNT